MHNEPVKHNLITAFKLMWSNMFYIEGKTNRIDFWLGAITITFINLILGILMIITNGNIITQLIFSIFGAFNFIMLLTAAIRRLHDINKTGNFLWLGLIPIIGWIILLVLFMLPTSDDNRHGVTTKPANDRWQSKGFNWIIIIVTALSLLMGIKLIAIAAGTPQKQIDNTNPTESNKDKKDKHSSKSDSDEDKQDHNSDHEDSNDNDNGPELIDPGSDDSDESSDSQSQDQTSDSSHNNTSDNQNHASENSQSEDSSSANSDSSSSNSSSQTNDQNNSHDNNKDEQNQTSESSSHQDNPENNNDTDNQDQSSQQAKHVNTPDQNDSSSDSNNANSESSNSESSNQ
ncbi:DUF805 domain-containing protein [Apilactobacillus ozensis]|uniref:DUF805 domain-containing protein n=1 Tax=Apilactobacillus ozensis TaxID=866801 RepID=UPI00200A114A|nr:DUF805 domain-containing protein [Apilactobacillus ozensis]MCK8607001.1 DUF805 domain-containing protein [Apilactobacillus ozensis]